MLTLYFAPGASSMAPHIALHRSVPRSRAQISLARKENRAAAYLALNPEGKVPTLLIDGRPLTEVAAILVYLAKRFPEAGFFPEGDIEAEVQAISWMSFLAATIHPAWARHQGIDRVRRRSGLRIDEWGMASGRWGASPSSTSICSASIGVSCNSHPAPGEFPHLSAHYDRMTKRSAVQKTCEIEAAIGYELPR